MVEVHHWYKTKSSNEGQIIEAIAVEVRCTRQSPLMRGRLLRPLVVEEIIGTLGGGSPLHETKSSDEGQIIETLSGRSSLHVTKFSNKGHITETLAGQS